MKKTIIYPILYLLVATMFFSISCSSSSIAHNSNQISPSGTIENSERKSTEVTLKPGDNSITINSLYPQFSLESLIGESHAIVIGEVKDVLPSIEVEDQSRPGEKMIYTNVMIEVKECLLGELDSRIIAIWVRGGRIGNNVMIVPDEPVYTVGDEITVFLRHTNPYYLPPDEIVSTNYYYVFAGIQGKYEYRSKDKQMIGWDDKLFSISELKQKIAELKFSK